MAQLIITFLEPFNNYLRISGQFNTQLKQNELIQKHIEDLLSRVPVSIPPRHQIEIGSMYITKRLNEYCRAIIIAFNGLNEVYVQHIDYGDYNTVNINELRSLSDTNLFTNISPQAFSFILSGIFSDWKEHELLEISNDLINQQVEIRKEMEFQDNVFVRIICRHGDYTEYLLKQKNIGYAITLEKMAQTFTQIIAMNRYKKQPQHKFNSDDASYQSKTKLFRDRPIPPPPSLSSAPFHSNWNPSANNQMFYQSPIRPTIPDNRIGLRFRFLNEQKQTYGNLESIQPKEMSNTIYRPPLMQQINPDLVASSQNSPPIVSPESVLPLNSSPKRSVMTFKCNTLMVGSHYDITCCYVENGPCLFSVHLKSTLEDLDKMASKLEKCQLMNLQERPSLGMACIARFSEDGQLYRAVIMDIKATTCQVAYVDYGNTEYVSFADIYEIPPLFLEPKIFAIRFALSGYKELEPIDDNTKSLFKSYVLHKDFRLRVMPLEGPPLLQYCELYQDDENMLKLLKQIQERNFEYSQSEMLKTGDVVVIRYVESPKKFFVQKAQYIEVYDEMMDDLFLYCTNSKSKAKASTLKKGAACAVKFDNAWYRAEIIGFESTNRVQIRHVDFGNERNVAFTQLSLINKELMKLPPQAIACCLKGFENAERLSDSSTAQLEMLAEGTDHDRRHFKCQVFEIQSDGVVLVNLIDDTIRPELNLMKKLYKLSMPFNKYIGLEKDDNFAGVSGGESMQSSNLLNSPLTVTNTSPSNNENQHGQNTSANWDANSSGSGETKDTGIYSDCRSSKRSNGKSFKDYNRRERGDRDGDRDREQSYQPFKAKSNIPPRFQKLKSENKRYKENKIYTNPIQRTSNTEMPLSSSNRSKPFNQSPQTYPSTDQWDLDSNTNIQQESVDDWGPTTDQADKFQNVEFLPLSSNTFKRDELHNLPLRENVTISWWISPHQFYTHHPYQIKQLELMLKEMNSFYKNQPSIKYQTENLIDDLQPNTHCVVHHYSDQLFYRAKIIAYNQNKKKFRVELLDVGNQMIADDTNIWQVEERFTKLPIAAHQCSLNGIVSNISYEKSLNYIDKYLKTNDVLVCEYVKRDEKNDIYYVELQCNDYSLKDLLIQDGIISAIDDDLNVKLLTGQQIQAKISSVQDLLNFQIETDGCDLKLLCSYNDIKFVKSNPNLSVEFKNVYEGTSCIIDILDVTGDKVLMVQPLIPLFNINIPKVICDYPVMRQALNIKIAHIETPNMIYVHSSARDSLYQLLNEMYEYYETKGEVLEKKTIGTLCAVKSSDENWYRGRILSNKNNQILTVYYIDYGNTEELTTDLEERLKELEVEFCQTSALAIRCFLPIKNTKEQENATIIAEMKSLISTRGNGTELVLNILERYKSSWIADICLNNDEYNNNGSSNDQSLINMLKEKSFIQGVDRGFVKNLIDTSGDQLIHNGIKRELYYDGFDDGNFDKQQQRQINGEENVVIENVNAIEQTEIQNVYEEEQLEQENITKNMMTAYLSHCDNPGRFFLHLTDDYNELRKLQDNIQIVAGSLPQLTTSETEALCITLYSVDETWYRAKVIDNEIMAVQFIDYGNTDVVTDSKLIKEMNEAFANIKPFAIPCALPIAPKSTTDWVDEANQIFNEAYDKIMYFKYISKGQKKNYVKLIIDGQNVTEKLIADGLARRLEVIESEEKCFISHINNLSDFYIQLERDTDGLELIAGHLSDADNFERIQYFVKGLICAAVFPEDGEWYRAMLIDEIHSHSVNFGVGNNDDGQYEVIFIDYGNKAVVSKVRLISDEIANIPFLSKKCSLWMPDYVLGWSDAAEEKFSELSAMGETVFEVELIEPGEHAVINLYMNDKNILEELESLCDRRPPTSSHILTDDFDLKIEKDIDVGIAEEQSDSENKSEEQQIQSTVEEQHIIAEQQNQQINFTESILSYVISPTDFYIQQYLNSILVKIIDQLNSGEILEIFSNPQPNDICVAIFDHDSAKYRAKLLSKTVDNQWKVFFIDYGNTAITSNQLYCVPDELKNLPPQCHRCQLYNPNGIDLKNKNTIKIFHEITLPFYTQSLQIKTMEQKSDSWIIQLNDAEKNLYEELENRLKQSRIIIDENSNQWKSIDDTSVPDDTNKNSSIHDRKNDASDDANPKKGEQKYQSVLISFINSPNDFYVQYLEDVDKLEQINQILTNERDNLVVLNTPKVGSICAGLHPHQECYYRAKIISIIDDKFYELFFVDIGSIELIENIRELPKNIPNNEFIAKHCSLVETDDHEIDLWYQNVCEKFRSFINSHFDETFNIEVLNKDIEPWSVKLFYHETNIMDELIIGDENNCDLTKSMVTSISFDNGDENNEIVDEIINEITNELKSIDDGKELELFDETKNSIQANLTELLKKSSQSSSSSSSSSKNEDDLSKNIIKNIFDKLIEKAIIKHFDDENKMKLRKNIKEIITNSLKVFTSNDDEVHDDVNNYCNDNSDNQSYKEETENMDDNENQDKQYQNDDIDEKKDHDVEDTDDLERQTVKNLEEETLNEDVDEENTKSKMDPADQPDEVDEKKKSEVEPAKEQKTEKIDEKTKSEMNSVEEEKAKKVVETKKSEIDLNEKGNTYEIDEEKNEKGKSKIDPGKGEERDEFDGQLPLGQGSGRGRMLQYYTSFIRNSNIGNTDSKSKNTLFKEKQQ